MLKRLSFFAILARVVPFLQGHNKWNILYLKHAERLSDRANAGRPAVARGRRASVMSLLRNLFVGRTSTSALD
ncbi:hypothetical protein EVAR_37277_1 [Eumeta japonica]|uniref:Secreted protein n=1 Tax=Eumeta variegata TaxID=151549 RepID=A0A4C1WJL6_EUMVA|nr:hypothetical protein EVAR_37277_1 [Eumeta japonica]